MAYLMHDKDHADTSDRVAWTHTHGLATQNPDTAWKIMAATAMSQKEIKDAAGIKATGRKSHRSVMHYSLSWHPEEREYLSKEDMVHAALGSMGFLGVRKGEKLGRDKKAGKTKYAPRTQFADEHQAVIVCHDDGPDAAMHVHVVVNMVNPKHGVFLPTNFSKEKLSAWALEYRAAMGKDHYCPQRIKNAAKKAQGLKTWHPRKSRAVYEAEKAEQAADPGSRKKALLQEQRRRVAQLQAKKEFLRVEQAKAVHQLEDRHLAEIKTVKAQAGYAIRAKAAKLKTQYDPKVDALTDRQMDEKQAFTAAKETLAGRVRNTWKALQTKEWMHDQRTTRISAVTEGFKLAFSSGMQQKQLDNVHKHELGQLRGERAGEERKATKAVRLKEAGRIDELRTEYKQQRNDLLLTHGMNNAKLKAEWQEVAKDRLAVRIEDERAKALKAAAERGDGSSSSGGKQPSQRPEPTPQADQKQTSAPVLPTYDIPIDELRANAREVIKPDEPTSNDPEQDPDPEIDR